MYLTLIFQIFVVLSALLGAIHLDPPLFLHIKYFSYQNTTSIKKGVVNFVEFFKLIFSEKIPVFSILIHDTGSKDQNSDAPSKVTYNLYDLSYENHVDSPRGSHGQKPWFLTYTTIFSKPANYSWSHHTIAVSYKKAT